MTRRGGAALRRGQLAVSKVLAFASALALLVGLVRILQAHVVAGAAFVVIAVALIAVAFALARAATRRR